MIVSTIPGPIPTLSGYEHAAHMDDSGEVGGGFVIITEGIEPRHLVFFTIF